MHIGFRERFDPGVSWSGPPAPIVLARFALLLIGLLLPLNLPFSIPPVGADKLFGWSGSVTSDQRPASRMIVSHTTRHARSAGLRPGDILLEIDGQRASSATLPAIRAAAAVGDTLILRVERGGSILAVAVPVSANVASYSGYIWYRLLMVLAAWAIGMALLIWRGRQATAVLVAAALITIPPSAFPNGVPDEGIVLAAAQTGWQLLATAHRILFPLLLGHFLVLHLRVPALLRSAGWWVPVYALAFALVFAITGGFTDPLARTQAGWQHDMRLASGGVFDALLLVAAATVWRQQKDDANPLRWMAFAICVFAATSLGHMAATLLQPAGPDPELIRRARALVLGLVPATAALHFHRPPDRARNGGEQRRLDSSAAVLLTVLYGSAVAGVAAVVLGATQTSLNGIEWLLFLAIFLSAIVFSPVLRWAREMVDRRMFAPWAETEARARAFNDRICAELDPVRIARRTALELPPLLEVESCALILDDEFTHAWDLPDGVDVSRAPRDELRGRVAAPSRDGAPAALPITWPDGELIGILALGPRLAHAPAGPAEDAIARSLARGLASAMRNAETYVALRRAQHELAETERITAMGALAGGLAHEIKNPLASLKMGLHLLERDGVDAQRLRRIQWDLRRIDDLVSGLLHYTNDDASEGPEVLDLRLLARACVDDLRSLASTRGVRIVELYPAENAIAVAGRSRLRLVISNLLRNALDAVSEDGRVEISIRLDPSHLELLVRDTGSGIPAGDREHVFALGFSTKPRGTGIGLAFARREIDRLHGHIEVVPGEDRGTTLRVVLPRLMYSS